MLQWIFHRDEIHLFEKEMPVNILSPRFKSMTGHLTLLFDGNDLKLQLKRLMIFVQNIQEPFRILLKIYLLFKRLKNQV